MDSQLIAVVDKVQDGIDNLYEKNPGMEKVKISSGLRGTKYFIEFPIVAENVDAFSLLNKVKSKMEKGKKTKGLRITGTDSFSADEKVAYLIDYSITSSGGSMQPGELANTAAAAPGTRCRGSVFIRGLKGQNGMDSFKFILEKENDFNPFDVEIILKAYENAFVPKAGQSASGFKK